ncbi:hypothetical protein [Zavarzinella formosa]|uniref:hypothetical protein n=1 Tax=Zavarzinella formosa TaxID=360055 RepID=UPI0012F866E9|nr:hypothetical protein [Zavarzinella formosa]
MAIMSCWIMLGMSGYVASVLWHDKISINEGMGWDGYSAYKPMAQRFEEKVFQEGVNAYYIKRILPPAIVYYSLRVLSVEPTPENIITSFEVLNGFALFVSLLAFIGLSHRFSLRKQWVLFFSLFVNFQAARFFAYYPVLTDHMAFACGMVALWAYVTNRVMILVAVTLAGSFVWPTFLFVGMGLLARPYDPLTSPPTGEPDRFKRSKILIVFTLALLTVVMISIPNDRWLKLTTSEWKSTFWPGTSNIKAVAREFAHFKVFAGAAIITAMLFPVIPRLSAVAGELPGYFRSRRILLVLVVALVVQGSVTLYVSHFHREASTIPEMVIINTINQSIKNIGVSQLAHAVFYGPLVLLCVVYWKSLCDEFHRQGTAMSCLLIMTALLAVGSESRLLTCVWPIMAFLCVKIIPESIVTQGFGIAFGVFSLVSTKIWFPMSVAELELTNRTDIFPQQSYFMNHGPWMSEYSYLVQLSFALIFGIILWVMSHRRFNCQLP